MKQILVVNNPNAGRKKALIYKKAVLKYLFNKNLAFKSISINEIENINVEEFDTIIVIGGDGTINKVLPLLINTDKTLGIIPCGTANLLAAKLGIPNNIKNALKIITKERTKKIDVISINDKFCVLRFGLGYDADIICKTPQSLKNKLGYFSYFIAGILFALRLKLQTYHITYDNNEINTKASCIIVANTSNMYKNIVSVCNKCEPDDGLMDVFILKAKNPIEFFIEFLNIIFKHRVNNPRAIYFKTSKLKIDNKWTMGHIDGEKKKIANNLELNIIRNAVNIFQKK